MIFISDVGNSNWFAFTIIIFYIYSYISFICIKSISRQFLGIIYINIIILYIFILHIIIFIKKKCMLLIILYALF